MNVPIDFLDGASLRVVRTIQDDDYGMADAFELKTPSETFGFEVQTEFMSNGNDHVLLIGQFGEVRLLTYKSFNDAAIQAIEEFIESYFLNHDIDHFTFESRRPVAVRFKDNWIIRGNGELYKSDGVRLHRLD